MNKTKIEIVKQLARDYNQFADSLLQPAINAVNPNASPATVRDWGESHCNLLSWYFALAADKRCLDPYAEYYRRLLRTGSCDQAGTLLLTKDKVSPLFGYKQNINYLEDFDLVEDPSSLDPDSFYQLKIIQTSHYMLSWVEDGVLMIACTGKRGVGVPAKGANRIDRVHFKWLLRMGE